MRAFQISALVETAVRDERERGIIRSKALEDAARQALEDICGAKLCEVNSMSSRTEMLLLMDRAITALRAALAEPVSKDQA